LTFLLVVENSGKLPLCNGLPLATHARCVFTNACRFGKVWWSFASLDVVEERLSVENLRDFLRISEAAEYIGVSPNTLRNWENAGKIASHRHPVNSYRLFKKKDLDALLRQLKEARREPPKED
jgi:MerR family copper efflux transcriptional regulator